MTLFDIFYHVYFKMAVYVNVNSQLHVDMEMEPSKM